MSSSAVVNRRIAWQWRIGVALLATALVLAVAPFARASSWASSVVDTTAPTGSVSLQAGQSAAIQIRLSVSGNQEGTATFKVYRDWTLTGGSFAGSNSETFTVPPRAGGDPATVFSTSGTVTVAASQTVGDFSLRIPVFDITNTNTKGGKLELGEAATYSVSVVAPTDSTPPVITPSVSGTLGSNGWYKGDVTVAWSVSDAQSTVTSTTGCGNVTRSTDTTGVTYTCTATSSGGTASDSVTIKRDATAPTITASPSTAANEVGWNKGDVTISYTCSDATSGLASTCPAADLASGDGTHTFNRGVTDQAGNSSSTITTVKIDATLPTITGARLTSANGNSWNNGPVTVQFTCTDGGTAPSGIKSCVAGGSLPVSDSLTVSQDGLGRSVTGTATDNADNSNTASVGGINIDTVPPQISYVGRTPANDAGWNNSAVTVTWQCTDGSSGPVSTTVSETLTGEGSGQSATGTCRDLAGNEAIDTQTGIYIDRTAPRIGDGQGAPEPNRAGWNNTDVSVTWQCSDDGSGVDPAAVTRSLGTEAANQSITGTCTDRAGNSASHTVSGINIDKSAPTVEYTSASPSANRAGWHKDDVVATFTATDSLSGFGGGSLTATGTGSTTGEGRGLTATSPAFTDLAGNTVGVGQASSPGFDVDKTRPEISFAGSSPAPNLAGWNSGDVTLTWTCADALSEAVEPSTTALVEGEGLDLSGTGTCTDAAGNQQSDSRGGVNIDRRAPNAPTVSLSTPANLRGWHKAPVTVSFTAAGDNGPSGVRDCSPASETVSVDTSGRTVAATCTDRADNTSSSSSVMVRLDQVQPTNVRFVGGPAAGARYFPNTVPASPTCTADDALSGLDSCSVTGYSTAVGTHTLLATATDLAGNVAQTSLTYRVRTLSLAGFFSPVDGNGIWNTVKNGSTVPLKFRVFDEGVEQTSTSIVRSFSTKTVSCLTGASEDPIEELATTGGTSLRYDTSGMQFVQNWKTPAKPGVCFQVAMTTVDDSVITALFKLK